ncbi:MAG: aspartate--ammonia ligase [Spirochaetia bacterium]
MSTGIPDSYTPILTLKQTEQAIKLIKDFFEGSLSSELRLRRVTAPLFVPRGAGINDDLNGVERPASFPVKHLGGKEVEMVQSLAKWKRMALADYKLEPGYGLYTDMNAVRPDDLIDNIHSIYVDQWDWELIMDQTQRNIDFLKSIARRIYAVLRRTEFVVQEYYPNIEAVLPDEIYFIHTEEALKLYPDFTPKERERELTRQYGAVFLIGIGGKLTDGTIHDGRAPDYDDWSTPGTDGLPGLNGDILVWNPVLEDSFELSSMGIRVDRDTLLRQLEIRGLGERKELYWHKRLLNGEFPQSIGGGIGQSRLCMYYLRKAHIGEVQSGLWRDETVEFCRKRGVPLM